MVHSVSIVYEYNTSKYIVLPHSPFPVIPLYSPLFPFLSVQPVSRLSRCNRRQCPITDDANHHDHAQQRGEVSPIAIALIAIVAADLAALAPAPFFPITRPHHPIRYPRRHLTPAADLVAVNIASAAPPRPASVIYDASYFVS